MAALEAWRIADCGLGQAPVAAEQRAQVAVFLGAEPDRVGLGKGLCNLAPVFFPPLCLGDWSHPSPPVTLVAVANRLTSTTESSLATDQMNSNASIIASEPLTYLDGRITVDPDLCNGRPTIRGLRITVETVLGFLGAGESAAEILDQYPSLDAQDIDACLRFAAELMSHRYSLKHVA